MHRDSSERAISILDRLFHAVGKRGWTITPEGKHTLITLGKDSLRCKLSERTRRLEHEPTEAEIAAYNRKKREREKRYRVLGWGSSSVSLGGRDWDQTWPDFDTVYTGQLAFAIDEYGGGLRKSWADGKTQTVEKLFDQILVGLEAFLAYEKSRREEREEWHRKSEEMQRRRALARQRKEREDKRVAFLRELINAQREAAGLRSWLSHTCLADEENDPGDLGRMLAWARQRLSELEAAMTPDVVSEKLSASKLFPEVDELHDPLGDPPDGYHWSY